MGAMPFLITIDTEGDNLWGRPVKITTENRAFAARFQMLSQKYGFKPVWLVNWEVVQDAAYMEMLLKWQQSGAAEIGMHLHAWNSPPDFDLTGNDFHHQPYLIDYPENVMEEKIAFMTQSIEKITGKKPVSHRAGRWAMDERYFGLLAKYGYKVDCSVTPNVDWRKIPGAPGRGGSDYTGYSAKPYFTPQGILEVPMTIRTEKASGFWGWAQELSGFPGKLVNKFIPSLHWLRPNGRNLRPMTNLVKAAEKEQSTHLEFMLHSSELMPGGSPYFKSKGSVENLYRDIESLFQEIAPLCTGLTLEEFHHQYKHLTTV